jgi:hypothetical protein
MAWGVCQDCGADIENTTGGVVKRCKPCSADDYERRHSKARQDTGAQILDLLASVRLCTCGDFYNAISSPKHAIRSALWRLHADGKIEHAGRGVYQLPLGSEHRLPVAIPVTGSAFIAPIPKHRLMAGRA